MDRNAGLAFYLFLYKGCAALLYLIFLQFNLFVTLKSSNLGGEDKKHSYCYTEAAIPLPCLDSFALHSTHSS